MKLPEIDESHTGILINWDKEDSIMTHLHIPQSLASIEFAMMLNAATSTFATLLQTEMKLKEEHFEQIVADIVENYNKFTQKHSYKSEMQ